MSKKWPKAFYDIPKMDGFSRSEFIFKGDTPTLEMNTVPGLRRVFYHQQAACAKLAVNSLQMLLKKQWLKIQLYHMKHPL